MRKSLILIVLPIAALLFSGCGGSSSTTDQTNSVKTYDIAKSIWKSTDGGTTWEVRNKSKDKLPVSDLDVLNIAVNPYAGGNILVGLKSGGYIKTENGGDLWEKTVFVSDRVYGLSFDPVNPKIIYSSGVWEGRGKLFRSDDAGVSWKEIFTSPSDGPFISALNIDSKNPKIIYASTSDNQTMKSEDAGATWKNIYQASSPIVKLAMDKANSNLIYAITLNGQVMRSRDGGVSFEDIGKNFSKNMFSVDQEYGFLEVDPQNTAWVYLTGKGGIIRSKDGGNTWEKVTPLNDPKNYPITALAINPKNSKELIYGAGQAVYKSMDGGQTWATFQFDVEKNISVIKYDPGNPLNIYIGFKKQ